MSKLDNIILECVNKALGGKEEKLSDYIDPTKQQVKGFITDIILSVNQQSTESDSIHKLAKLSGRKDTIIELCRKIEKL